MKRIHVRYQGKERCLVHMELEIFRNAKKSEVFEKSLRYWNSGKTREWLDLGIDLVIGDREGYYFWDLDGKKLMDVHINGGTYSLGHRNPEIIRALTEGMKQCDIGNHHFPSVVKAALAETVIRAVYCRRGADGPAPERRNVGDYHLWGGPGYDCHIERIQRGNLSDFRRYYERKVLPVDAAGRFGPYVHIRR